MRKWENKLEYKYNMGYILNILEIMFVESYIWYYIMSFNFYTSHNFNNVLLIYCYL